MKNRVLYAVWGMLMFAGATMQVVAATVVYDPAEPYATGIQDLLVGGILYDATFHPFTAYDDVWTGSDLPTFWENQTLATEAAGAIIASLGSAALTSTVSQAPSDGILVPYMESGNIFSVWDLNKDPGIDSIGILGFGSAVNAGGWAYVTFSPVPLPGAVWLFGSGLLGLIGMARGTKTA